MGHRVLLRLLTIWAISWMLALPLSTGFAAGTLTGNINQDVYLAPNQHNGVIFDQRTGQPIAGAVISVPDLGLSTVSGANGTFALRNLPAHQRVILSVQKPGYLPQNAIMETDRSLNQPMRIGIRQSQRVLVIDPALHHLGDNNYSRYSSGAGQFRQHAEGSVLVRQFSLQGHTPSRNSKLVIGAVIGLDTLRAHQAGQSAIPYASSPVVVKLNGQVIAHITVNGVRQRMAVPAHLLRPHQNILEIQAGYHRPDGVRVDYDDLELMNVMLEL